MSQEEERVRERERRKLEGGHLTEYCLLQQRNGKKSGVLSRQTLNPGEI